MSVLSGLASFINGGVFSDIKELILAYRPPSMSDEEKARFDLESIERLHERQLKANMILNEATDQLNQRIRENEGTASDLKSMPYLGRFVLFLRGAQRPIWGYATIYIDLLWFFGNGDFTQNQEKALIVINWLVLGFLFGERTLLNLEPMILKLFGKQKDGPEK